MRRFGGLSRLAIGTVVAIGLLTGCRDVVRVEGELAAAAFKSAATSLTKDPAGRWYVVVAPGQALSPYAVIEYQGQVHAFWTAARGERSAELLPLTRVPIEWFNGAMQHPGATTTTLVEGFSDELLASTVGMWAGGDSKEIRWLGPMPTGLQSAVVLRATGGGDAGLSERMVGTLVVDEQGVHRAETGFSAAEGPYLVIPEAPVMTPQPTLATYTGEGIPEEVLADVVERGAAQAVRTLAELREVGAGRGAEILVGEGAQGLLVGLSTEGLSPGFGPGAQRLALAESGVWVGPQATEEMRRHVLEAMVAIYHGYPLKAAYHLAQVEGLSVDGSVPGAELRQLDLLAAAGYGAWARRELAREAEGYGAEASLAIARAYAYEGQWDAVVIYAERAAGYFERWPTPQRELGRARAYELGALASVWAGRERGLERAQQRLARALTEVQRVDDPLRAGRIARVRGWLALNLGNAEEAEEHLELARQGFARAGSRYEEGRLALNAAYAFYVHGARDSALRAYRRWEREHAPEARPEQQIMARALAVALAVEGAPTPGEESWAQLRARARELRAWDALLFASIEHYQTRHYEGADATGLGRAVLLASSHTALSLLDKRIDGALAGICAEVLFVTSAGPLGGQPVYQCASVAERYFDDITSVEPLFGAAYRFLQHGDLTGARAALAYVKEGTPGARDWAITRAQIYLLEAAILIDEGRDEDVPAALSAAYGLLDQALPAGQRPDVLLRLAESFDLRGFDDLAIPLTEAALEAALSGYSKSLAYDAALALAERLWRAQRWEDLAALESPESALHAARVTLYRAQAEAMLANAGTARELSEEALAQARQFGDLQRLSVGLLALELALERRDLEEVARLGEQLQSDAEGARQSVRNSEAGRVLQARLQTLRARYDGLTGERERAITRMDLAREMFDGLALDVAPGVRAEVLEGSARVTPSGDKARAHTEALRTLFDAVSRGDDRRARREIARRLAGQLIMLNEGARALEVVSLINARGDAISGVRAYAHCVRGEALGLIGKEAARYHLERCAQQAPADGELASRSLLLTALSTPEASLAYRAELAAHLLQNHSDRLSPFERQRFELIAGLAAGLVRLDPEAEAELRKRITQAPDTPARMEAVRELGEALLKAGHFEELERLLHAESSTFHAPGVDGAPYLALLRLSSLVHQARPFEALAYASRVLVEAPTQTPHDEARVALLMANAYLQQGQPLVAQVALERAREAIRTMPEPHDAALVAEFEALESAARPSR
ncbi:hypothetical protein DL240_05980 [Lujinxingia litoralis]|uniref:Uncharacterized protein n=1 Tax=Lujinxingia litoralis TaxID=2211119 RepID=A0A328C6Y2_9DELT|nr:hypothetical protein [Lujinxingia litoralis]RAL23705.1 hypothetical protein DL240_05980 [Lujinxingia litoralis]